MARKTPGTFRFVVKLHQSMTHERSSGVVHDRHSGTAIEPLRAAGKFDGLLAQFPWGFRRDDANKRYLEQLRERFPTDPLWVEFRHISWVHVQLPAWLRERRLGYCIVDEPALHGLVPPHVQLTSADGYVRFHGRNTATWWAGRRRALRLELLRARAVRMGLQDRRTRPPGPPDLLVLQQLPRRPGRPQRQAHGGAASPPVAAPVKDL